VYFAAMAEYRMRMVAIVNDASASLSHIARRISPETNTALFVMCVAGVQRLGGVAV
jgi:hypothetical protein